MFEAEAEGLRELASTNTIRIPEVYGCGIANGEASISMERINFEASTAAAERQLGEQLAALHRRTAEQFGWHRDNTIGLTPQINTPSKDWTSFFREHRLDFQLRLAANNGYAGELQKLGRNLSDGLPELFADYVPEASLLHGDLWGGNWGVANGEPIIFDPAVYYGDRETDVAMTKLFGGFGRPFYEAYESAWPLSPGHEQRCELYQLYHVLNHLNLFGVSYLGKATAALRGLTN